ncbi:hypothetical protein [Sediminibacterium soli]|uniref:hypothetical protein n=1 Tax=Sediminibacterium soli TaxID=2698829 RepID=UPI00137A6728|nr:hypothetical protein [Sediminibacterium soli]NCI47607.1 hypothetical protein [Sediminibacterium soli]
MVYIFITVVIAGVLSLAFLIRALLARGPYSDDYWWFIAMVSFPLATGFFCL